MEEYLNVRVDALQEFTTRVFTTLGVPPEDASISAEILIIADQRGIGSHGLQRLIRYVNGLKTGVMKPVTRVTIVKETPNTLLISGGDGLGQVAGYQTMRMVIDKALKNNVAMAAVRDSNHYGIAGYYAMMGLEHDLIGVSLTNTAMLVVPTLGKNALMGTNPIAIAIPAGRERPFVLDMATSTVPRGKLEVYKREGKTMPGTWATDEFGKATQDPVRVLANLVDKRGGGLLPLGGAEEIDGGHKGYGLCLAVDLFCGVLAGSAFGPQLYASKDAPAKVSHFFGAIKIDAFIQPNLFKNLMDEYINILKNSQKAEGEDRIYIHGEKEYELYEKQKQEVDVLKQVVEELRQIGEGLGIKASF